MSGESVVRAGTRLKSPLSPAEILVVRAPKGAVEITLGEAALVSVSDAAPPSAPDGSPGEGEIRLGKRYLDETSGLELLCTKSGPGTLACDGRPLELQAPKPLPSSD